MARFLVYPGFPRSLLRALFLFGNLLRELENLEFVIGPCDHFDGLNIEGLRS